MKQYLTGPSVCHQHRPTDWDSPMYSVVCHSRSQHQLFSASTTNLSYGCFRDFRRLSLCSNLIYLVSILEMVYSNEFY